MKVKEYVNTINRWITGSREDYSKKEDPLFYGGYDKIDKEISKNRKNLKRILAGALIILVVVMTKGFLSTPSIQYDQQGNARVIKRQGLDRSETFNLTLETEKTQRNVSIVFSSQTGTKASNNVVKDQDYYINQTVNEIRRSKGSEILLPNQLSNGESITWRESIDYTPLYIIFFTLTLVVILRQSRYSQLKKYKSSCKESITRTLPSFINRIIITWKSGSTFSDALKKATQGCKGDGFFSIEINRMLRESNNTGDNYLRMLNEFAIKSQVKELKKLSNIMMENQDKGSFLLDKLESEREAMWEKRKNFAKEEGKKAETKLVIPMTILLLGLIMVTAAPAFLVM